jgi:alpha-tubulin suppressor-like RCC1 family protein
MGAWQSRTARRAALVLSVTLGVGCGPPSAPQPCGQVVALGAAADTVGVVKADGSLWTWGAGVDAPTRLDGTFAPSALPADAFCVRQGSNTIWCPLVNQTLPATATSASILADSWIFYADPSQPPVLCAVLADGTLTCRLHGSTFAVEATGVGVVGVGLANLCATDTSGAVFCRNVPPHDSVNWDRPAGSFPALDGMVEIVPTDFGYCGRKADGSVWCWGEGFQLGGGPTDAPTDVEHILGLGGNVKALATSASRVCALREDGAVLCWSNNQPFDRVVPGSRLELLPQEITGLPMAATAIVTQFDYACALLVDQTVWCWGKSLTRDFGGGPVAPDGPKPLTGCGP